jgi:Flp pilus assembly protein TadD
VAVALVLVLVAYSNGLGGAFVFDDIPLVRDAPHVRSLSSVGPMLALMAEDQGHGYRPVRTLSHMLEHRIFGLRPFGYHTTNVLLHALTCILLFFLARRLGLSPAASMASMALFAVHPVHTEAVTYISGRRDLLFSLFLVAGMLAYVRGVQERSRLLVLAALPLYLLGVFSKEQGITLPAVLYLWEVLVNRSQDPWPRRLVSPLLAQPAFWAAIWAGAGAFFLYRGVLLPRTFHPGWWGGSASANFATVLAVHVRYLAVQLWPVDLLADYSPHAFRIADGFRDGRALLGLGILASSLALAAYTLRRYPLVALAIVTYWILLLPVSHLIPHHELAAEHQVYLPSGCLCLLAGAGVALLERRRTWAGAGLLVLAAVLMTGLTISRNRVWHDGEALWSDTVARAPRCGRALLNLGLVYFESGELERAEPLLRRSIGARDLPRAHATLGNVLSKKGRYQEAHATLAAAYRRFPSDPHVIRFHALNLLRTERAAEALGVLEKGVGLWPSDPELRYLLGGCYLAAGRPGDALEQNLLVLSLAPDHEDGRRIAVKLARHLGRTGLARKLEDGWSPE